MAEKKSSPKTLNTLVYIVLLVMLVITVAEGYGYDAIGWLRAQLSGGVYQKVETNLYVNFVDVGQGDCIYITSGGQNILIDCGEASESDNVISYLNKQNVNRLDYVIITHPHSDHMGGMDDIILSYDIGEVIMPRLADNDIPDTRYFENFLDACSKKGLYITEAQVGRTFVIGEASAEIIAPTGIGYKNHNDYSVGLLLKHGNNDFLFTGDAEALAEKEMLETGKLEHVRVYKAGHHGSSTSSSKAFMEIVSPDYAVITCGAGNSYGHPHDEIVNRLSKYVKKIYRSDINGNIEFESDGLNLMVRSER